MIYITQKCPAGTPSPRAEQCESKQQMRFIDGNKYQWAYNPAIPVPGEVFVKGSLMHVFLCAGL